MGDKTSSRAEAQRARILEQLRRVEAEIAARAARPGLPARVQALKAYQQRRFERSYADLLAVPRYAAAAQFFLDELYGPADFSRRDAQFARVVPALVRLFPAEVVDTVAQLAELHGLSEQLDSAMGAQLLDRPRFDAADYARAWQAAATPAQRERQIELLLSVGLALDALTRKPLLRQALRMMRGPATAAGLAELQRFLESGFDTFKAMGGAADFLDTVAWRERALAAALFSPQAPQRVADCPAGDSVLGQLP
ncbi:hypothetical protein G8A07_24630 [Roseateles sp. DAIF2]|uniref:FFLEELY motif protein n=1 Tax=Roseateles sp. DAIF2 TaxID=2714952 RepID=UPI0018A2C1EF|nr:hypothetical protein [Roseateles sp. DAIF2]QPF75788.1 hypothetical protein G8A07_24630 [Roseateles sp. DAIF2]